MKTYSLKFFATNRVNDTRGPARYVVAEGDSLTDAIKSATLLLRREPRNRGKRLRFNNWTEVTNG